MRLEHSTGSKHRSMILLLHNSFASLVRMIRHSRQKLSRRPQNHYEAVYERFRESYLVPWPARSAPCTWHPIYSRCNGVLLLAMKPAMISARGRQYAISLMDGSSLIWGSERSLSRRQTMLR